MAKKKKKVLAANLTIDQIASKYEGSGIAEDYLPDPDDMFWVPSSSAFVNHKLGGGAAYGRIIEIAGQESSGKTLLALDIIKTAQELGGVGVFVDAELAFSKSWALKNELDLSLLYIFEENVVEIIADFVAEIALHYRAELTANEPIVLVVDSIAAMDTMAAMAETEEGSKAEMGRRAKAVFKMLRLRNRLWARLGVTVICVNQLRDAINTGFGAQFKDKHTTPGGGALKFYASQRIFLETKKQLTVGAKARKRRYGIEVMFQMKKNKLAIPRVPARIPVVFDPNHDDLGFSKFHMIAELAIAEGGVDKSGNTYSFDGEVVANSLGALQTKLEEDDDFREDVMFAANIMTIEQMQTRLDDEPDNRYPVSSVKFESFAEAKDSKEDDDEE